MNDDRRLSAYVTLRLRVPLSVLERAGCDLTTKDEDDDAPYSVAEQYVAENWTDLLDYAELIESGDVEVEFDAGS